MHTNYPIEIIDSSLQAEDRACLRHLQIVRNVVWRTHVVGIKSVHTNETIFRPRRERLAERVNGESVDGAEVALDTPELFSINHVEEARLELATTS